ncbi:hypothetical protein NQZ68_031143 [Dissostichus eleginoides]|nr:hypothetical protein NQZ68_031143 [Dissostichus eleginoides]
MDVPNLRNSLFIIMRDTNKRRQPREPAGFCDISKYLVKVWFQNRRMKWKRVKGGQQGAALRDKDLINVKKGTLLSSELSETEGQKCSPRLETEEDSQESDQSSDNLHL